MENIASLLAMLKKKSQTLGQSNVDVGVGYSADYALQVHEDLERHHANGQAKFLEQSARQLRGELARVIRESLKNGSTVKVALVLAANLLKEASQKLVPVQTGNLRDSAFVSIESYHEEAPPVHTAPVDSSGGKQTSTLPGRHNTVTSDPKGRGVGPGI